MSERLSFMLLCPSLKLEKSLPRLFSCDSAVDRRPDRPTSSEDMLLTFDSVFFNRNSMASVVSLKKVISFFIVVIRVS
ncbi:MAG: hypothetical protein QXO15_02900 [Nitrososphaerota archaeon]